MDPNWREYLADPDHTYTRDPVYPQDRYPKSTYPPTPLSPQYYPISDQGYPHNQALFYRDEWDCHNCDKSFDTELERDRHMDLCMQGIPGLLRLMVSVLLVTCSISCRDQRTFLRIDRQPTSTAYSASLLGKGATYS